MTIQSSSPFLQRPGTRMGWWADSLAAAFVVLFIINAAVVVPASEVPSNDWWRQTWLPFWFIFVLLCGLAAGAVGLIAVINKHERSWLVWLTIPLGAFVLFIVLFEFLVPH